MSQDQTKKEALFNEVKGSLFEYLVAKNLAQQNGEELIFQKSLDQNYLTVLSQQDRMIRQFYPEMLKFLVRASELATQKIVEHLQEIPKRPKVLGKLSNSPFSQEWFEADLMVETSQGELPISLKLNKKNSFVNTKSGGIKSFFTQYFPFLDSSPQTGFNQLVDLEFNRMALELHALHDMDYPGHFGDWVKRGFSELPGELDQRERSILKSYYARIAREMHLILSQAQTLSRDSFGQSLMPLMGFGSSKILQVICFHEFKSNELMQIEIHQGNLVEKELTTAHILPFGDISLVEIQLEKRSLQIRVKPMNKFTTTAIKINCSVKERD